MSAHISAKQSAIGRGRDHARQGLAPKSGGLPRSAWHVWYMHGYNSVIAERANSTMNLAEPETENKLHKEAE